VVIGYIRRLIALTMVHILVPVTFSEGYSSILVKTEDEHGHDDQQ